MSWADTAAPLSMVVACGGERHRLRWDRGEVITVDHPELEAELALVAFGGAEPACIALHRLWHEAVADGGFLAEWADPTRLSPVWLSWLGMALERMRTEGFHEFLRHLPPARAQRMGEFLNRFPPAWIDRAAAEASRLAAERGALPDGTTGDVVVQAVVQRLRRSFVDAVGGRQLAVGAAALIPLRATVEAGAAPSIEGALRGPSRGVTLRVDPTWLHRVWAAGAAVVGGRLTLALPDPPPGPAPGPASDGASTAIQVDWPDGAAGPPVLVTRSIHHDGVRWSPGEGSGEGAGVDRLPLER